MCVEILLGMCGKRFPRLSQKPKQKKALKMGVC